MKNENNKIYSVLVEDIWHQPLTSPEDIAEYRYKLNDFNGYEEAVEACKKFLDDDFNSIVADCANESDFYGYWSFHGEDLFITPASSEELPFSSRTYMEEKVKTYFKKH